MNVNDAQSSFAPPQPSASTGWHQDFIGQSANGQPQHPGTSQQPFFRGTNSYPANPSHALATPYLPAQEDVFDQRQSQGQAQDLDDALFEKHFAAAALEVDQTMGQAEANLQPMNGEILENARPDQAFDDATRLGPSIQRDIRSEPVIDAGIHDPIGSDRILPESDAATERSGSQSRGGQAC